ncbi:MAG: bifunctional 4-hydroxy-2-oxoglutarate aldolase/2-dehydro-3-deoxy-phosphogluconate aldolase [Desulfobulbaceae bacterium]|nr:MAG: bifunctional 4-hydroxy-2-oxoglutarate aldolase/2-dehydro-3-deoxy-phosphogluconate aldolase [Desulfobulbaceae bacterium]
MLERLKLVPVVSLPSVQAGLELAEILIDHNLPVIEVTFRTPYAADAISAMKEKFNELLILAGTVLAKDQVDIASDAGAECIVIPGFHAGLVDYCQAKNLMVCPGTVTPSEVLQCYHMGLKTVKFFPAEVSGGAAMLKAMAAVFTDMKFMPTGGINLNNLREYLSLDSVFCCGGSWLAPEDMLQQEKWDAIAQRIGLATKQIDQQL